MFSDEMMERVAGAGVIAALTIDDPENAASLARALLAGGIRTIELTLRTPQAVESIRRIRAEAPEMLIGAGTVLNGAQLGAVKAAGACFAVSPGCNPSTLRRAAELEFPFAPGVATASDIEIAVAHGCRLLKYFPAETSGGLAHLAALAAPFDHLGLRYIPLGGIVARQLADYLKSPLVAAVGGSWLAKPDVIARREWSAITGAAREAMTVVREVRGTHFYS
jgi:2-dehydro-3-deoxyphosphogluconate aldolase/(4S)-4-hydroxy-2-oxoglutarate aldolase